MGVLAKPPEDVLHVDDGVIDESADRHGEAAQGHGVDRQAESGEDNGRHRHRKGDRRQGYQRGPHVHEEEEKHGEHEQGADPDRLEHVVHGPVDKIGLAEKIVDHLDVLGETLADRNEFPVDRLGKGHRVGLGLFENGKHDSRLAADPRLARPDRGGAEIDVRHVLDAHGTDRVGPDHGVGEFLLPGDESVDGDERRLVADVQDSPGDVLVGVANRLRHGVERDTEGAEFLGVDDRLELTRRASRRHNLGDTGDRHQPVPDVVIGMSPDRVGMGDSALRPQPDELDLAHDARYRRHEGFDTGRQLVAGELKLLLDNLPVSVDIGSPVELDEEHGESRTRRRPDAHHVGGAVEHLLKGKGDETLDVLGHHRVGFGHDCHRGPVEVGKHVDRHQRRGVRAVAGDEEGRRDDEDPVPQ